MGGHGVGRGGQGGEGRWPRRVPGMASVAQRRLGWRPSMRSVDRSGGWVGLRVGERVDGGGCGGGCKCLIWVTMRHPRRLVVVAASGVHTPRRGINRISGRRGEGYELWGVRAVGVRTVGNNLTHRRGRCGSCCGTPGRTSGLGTHVTAAFLGPPFLQGQVDHPTA